MDSLMSFLSEAGAADGTTGAASISDRVSSICGIHDKMIAHLPKYCEGQDQTQGIQVQRKKTHNDSRSGFVTRSGTTLC